jgi:hypothetical protein
MLLYLLEVLTEDGTWQSHGLRRSTETRARDDFLQLIKSSYNPYRAARIVSLWQCWDKEWRVKEVLFYKEFRR